MMPRHVVTVVWPNGNREEYPFYAWKNAWSVFREYSRAKYVQEISIERR